MTTAPLEPGFDPAFTPDPDAPGDDEVGDGPDVFIPNEDEDEDDDDDYADDDDE